MTEGSDVTPGRERRLGGFKLVRVLASGSQGDVYEAVEDSSGLHVALKILRPNLAFDRKSLHRFQREARAGARLDHASIVRVHAVGEAGGVHYIAQELVGSGRTLANLIDDARNRAELPDGWYRAIALIGAQVAEALAAAHDLELMHRDVKPRNILIAEDGRPKVADFGLARMLDEHELTSTGDMLGTPFYMSPEQVRARPDGIDERTDIFSLGVVLYEALTLTRPFTGDTPQILDKIQHFDPPDPRRMHGRVPRDLAVICLRALEKRPDRRYATARDLAADLRRYLAGQPIVARPPGPLLLAGKWIYRHRVASLIASVVLAASIAVTVSVFKKNAAEVARLEEKSAKEEQERRREVEDLSGTQLTEFIENLFTGSDERSIDDGEPALMPLSILMKGVRCVEGISQEDPRWHLMTVLGSGFMNLGRFDRAREQYEAALDLARRTWGEYDTRTVGTQLEMGRLSRLVGDLAAAQDYDVAARRGNVMSYGEGSPQVRAVDAELGLLAQDLGDLGAAERLLRKHLDECSSRVERPLDDPDSLLAMHALGRLVFEAGRLDEAAPMLDAAWEHAPGVLTRLRRLQLAGTMADLREAQSLAAVNANRLDEMARLDAEAEGFHRQAVAGRQQLLGSGMPETASALTNFGRFLRRHARYGEARAVLGESLSIYLKQLGEDDVGTLYARNNLGVLESAVGNEAAAEAQLLAVLSSDRRHPQRDAQIVVSALHNLSRLAKCLGRLDDAERFAYELVARTPRADSRFIERRVELAALQQSLSAVPSNP